MKIPEIRGGTHIDLIFWCKSRCIACTKRHIMSGTHLDLLFGSKSRCFTHKNYWWWLEPIETSNSGANHALLLAQNNRLCLGQLETCYSCPKVAVLHPKTTHESWDPWRLVILMLSTLFCVHKTTGEVWDPQRLVILLQKPLFCMQKQQISAETHRD